MFAVAPNPYDNNGYLAIGGISTDGVQSSLTLAGMQAFSSSSVFIGPLDAYNRVLLLNAAGAVIETFTGVQMAGGANIPFPGTPRRITPVA